MKTTAVLLFMIVAAIAATAQINTDADDYACSFRTSQDGTTEFWFTSGRVSKDHRSRALYVGSSADNSFENPIVADAVFVRTISANDIVLDGTPTFGCCPNYMVFSSNRLSGGRYYGNDLYESNFENGHWAAPSRISILCSDAWDDSPAISPDGNFLYFSSDRKNPGTRDHADLYISRRIGNSWTEPRPIDDINTTDFSEETPYVGDDGYLYYSTNQNGDFDIWCVKLNSNGLPEGKIIKNPIPEVNQSGSDETHPCFSGGGGFFLYSTNAHTDKRRKDFDIAWKPIVNKDLTIELDVQKIVPRKEDPSASESMRFDTRVHFSTDGKEVTRDLKGRPLQLHLSDILPEVESPFTDQKYFRTTMYADVDNSRFVSSRDIIIGARNCKTSQQHTIFVWDTTALNRPGCKERFPIDDVPYFISGYWCPTTKEYERYMHCASLFIADTCSMAPCQDNALYRFIPAKPKPAHPECVNYKQFEDNGKDYADKVDAAIYAHLQDMASVFSKQCISLAIERGDTVHVEVEGFTDYHSVNPSCQIFGDPIDWSSSFVKVPQGVQGRLTPGYRLTDYAPPTHGNQVLSELRAYHLAVLLDNLWTERIPQYRALKEQHKLDVVATGRAIDTSHGSDALNRSARVTVSAMQNESTPLAIKAQPGSTVLLCSPLECGCNGSSQAQR